MSNGDFVLIGWVLLLMLLLLVNIVVMVYL